MPNKKLSPLEVVVVIFTASIPLMFAIAFYYILQGWK